MRKLMWFALGFTAACALGSYCYVSWLFPAAVVLLALSLVLLLMTRRFSFLKIAAAVVLGVSLGLGWFFAHDQVMLKPAREMDKTTQTVTILSTSYCEKTDDGGAVEAILQLDGRYIRVKAYLKNAMDVEPGDRITGRFRFAFTVGKSPYYQGEGTFLVAYPVGDAIVQQYEGLPWYGYPVLWREEMKRLIDSAFPADAAGFAKALLLGDRSGIDYVTNTAFKVGGISHVIAVSGLHVSILFGLIYLLTARRRVLTALIGIPVVVIFAAIAGFSPSITRAGIMQILMMFAMLWDREYDAFTALGFSALIMEVVNPLVVTSVSFQLSMGCMIGIFLFSQPIREWMMDEKRLGKWKGKVSRWFSGSVSVTLSSMIVTTPLVAVYFETVSIVSVLTNLLTLWVITFVFYGIMLVCLLGLFSAVLAQAAAWIVAWPIRFVLTVSKLMASLPMAAVYTKSIYITLWLVEVYVLLAIYLVARKKPAALFGSLIIISLCVSVGLSWLEPLLWECRVTVLDVGQGQSVILQSGGKTYLVDCGGSYDSGAADEAAETLLSMGIRRLDGIILTHLDADHAGGVELLLTRVTADALYLPRVVDDTGAGERLIALLPESVTIVGEDISLSYENTKLTIFAPVSVNSGNESSMCILFQTENCDILIPGDRGFVSEQMLLDKHRLPELELLVVGHHGSKYSTCEELLAQTTPEYAFISVGKNNYYGHPAQETLDRLFQYGCQVFTTADSGTIIFRR